MRRKYKNARIRVEMEDGTLAAGQIVRETLTTVAGWLIRVGRTIVWRDREGRS